MSRHKNSGDTERFQFFGLQMPADEFRYEEKRRQKRHVGALLFL
jgi:hypothetical protein